MKFFATGMIALATAFPCAVSAQTASGAKPIPRTADQSSFTKTADGDWKTTVRRSDGAEHDFVVVPSSKVDPKVTTQVSISRTGSGFRIVYSYELTNGSGAKQELARLFVGTVQPVAVSQLPQGWSELTPQTPGSLALHGPLSDSGIPAGLSSGQHARFSFAASALPGVVTVRAGGNTVGAIQVPPGLTAKQREDLEVLAGKPDMTTVNVPAIGPAIAVGVSEPELTFEVVLTRVRGHYEWALTKFKHPAAAEAARLFGNAQRPEASLDLPAVREALTSLGELARKPVADPWHQQLSMALGICVDALLSGAVPVR